MHQPITTQSVDLQHAAERFAQWRRNKTTKRSRIPEDLWELACRAAKTHGVCKTSTALKLDYYRLKRRLEGKTSGDNNANGHSPQRRRTAPVFVEVPSALGNHLTECELEWSNGLGARLVLRWKGTTAPDLALLGNVFNQR